MKTFFLFMGMDYREIDYFARMNLVDLPLHSFFFCERCDEVTFDEFLIQYSREIRCLLPFVDIFFSHASIIQTDRGFLDSFWYFRLMRLDESLSDHVFGNRMEYWTCSAHTRYILHHTLISIAHPDSDDRISMVSDGPVIMEVGTRPRLHRQWDGGIEDTRDSERSRAIFPIGEYICEEKVRSTFLRDETQIGMNDILEGHFDRTERNPVPIVSSIMIE